VLAQLDAFDTAKAAEGDFDANEFGIDDSNVGNNPLRQPGMKKLDAEKMRQREIINIPFLKAAAPGDEES
jgi:hypothetical protein